MNPEDVLNHTPVRDMRQYIQGNVMPVIKEVGEYEFCIPTSTEHNIRIQDPYDCVSKPDTFCKESS